MLAVASTLAFAHGNTTTAAPKAAEERWYIFGYGSLFDKASITRTNCKLSGISENNLAWVLRNLDTQVVFKDKEIQDCVQQQAASQFYPARATGVRRDFYAPGGLSWGGTKLPQDKDGNVNQAWSHQSLFVTPTYLGTVPDAESTCTGLAYPVTKEQLDATDAREAGANMLNGELSASDVDDLTPDIHSNGSPWANARIRVYYSNASRHDFGVPSPEHPIVQSYVNLFIGGASDVGIANNLPNFALETCQSTMGWSNYWVNDLATPYRAFSTTPQASSVNKALLQCAGVGVNTKKTSLRGPKVSSQTKPGEACARKDVVCKRTGYPGEDPHITDAWCAQNCMQGSKPYCGNYVKQCECACDPFKAKLSVDNLQHII